MRQRRGASADTDELARLVRVERLALVELLETLTEPQWDTPSLCDGWRVRDVAAHLAWAPVVPALQGFTGIARSGFRPNRFIADSAVTWAGRGVPAILDQLRINAATGTKPMGVPRTAVLVDAVVRGLAGRL